MHATTMTAPAVAEDRFVRLSEACRLTGLTRNRVRDLALGGAIRAKVLPGSLPRYSRLDCIAVAEGDRVTSRA